MVDEITTVVPTAPEQPSAPDNGDSQITPASSEIAASTSGSGESSTPASSSSPNWDDDNNPWKYAAQAYQQKLSEYQEAQVQTDIRAEAEKLAADGADPAQVQRFAQMKWQEYRMGKQQEALQEQARPVVASMLTDKIREQYGVTISPNELLTASNGTKITSPEAMLARADALVTERRTRVVAERAKVGADKVDNTGSNGTGGRTWAQAQRITSVSDITDEEYFQLVS